MMTNLLSSSVARLRFLLVMLVTICVSAEVWGETWSHEFTSLPSISDQKFIVNDLTWNVTTTIGKGSPEITLGNDNSIKSMKFGSGQKNYYSNIALSTSYFSNYNVKSVEIIGCGNTTNNINIIVTQGSNENIVTIGSATINKSYASNWNTISECIKTINTNEGSGGLLTISISPTTCAFSLRKITVTYEEGITEPSRCLVQKLVVH